MVAASFLNLLINSLLTLLIYKNSRKISTRASGKRIATNILALIDRFLGTSAFDLDKIGYKQNYMSKQDNCQISIESMLGATKSSGYYHRGYNRNFEAIY